MEFPAEPVVRSVIQAYARVIARFGEDIGERPLVLPTAEFFPDKFVGDADSVQRLLDRMLDHAGMDDVEINAELVGVTAEGKSCGTGGCGSGACGTSGSSDPSEEKFERLTKVDAGYVVRIHEREIGHPVVLTAELARAVASVFLIEADEHDPGAGLPIPVAVELTTVALGFGSLLLQGSYIYQKSCGGPSVARITELSCGELAIAYALFAAAGKHPLRKASKELGATQQEFLSEAKARIDANRELVAKLLKNPERIASGEFELEEPRSWLARLFSGKKKNNAALDADASLEELEAAFAHSSAKPKAAKGAADPKFDEIRKLVDEALSE